MSTKRCTFFGTSGACSSSSSSFSPLTEQGVPATTSAGVVAGCPLLPKGHLKKIRSSFILKKIFWCLEKKKKLETIRYNKSIQERINININHYKEYTEKYSSIEIEMKPMENEYGRFININKEYEEYYHIYYNDNKKEQIKSTSLNKNDKVSKINIIIDYQVKSFNNLFYNCKCIESICFKKFYRNNITGMSNMFYGCSSLTNIDLSNFNTDNVTDMSGMFCDCSSLKELNLNNFNNNNVTNMRCMFSGCSSLTNINLSNFNTNNVTNMSCMFNECSSLTNIDLSNFNTKNVTTMSGMFGGCLSLTNIDLSNFDTSNVTNMYWMFYGCSSLEKLNLNNFNTSNVIDMSDMFNGCSSLIDLDLSNFDTSSVFLSNGMFDMCQTALLKNLKKKKISSKLKNLINILLNKLNN